jgi:ABC-type Fe3+/spermidine/putrescine transport system ATPase subunit
VTHDQEEALGLASRVAVLAKRDQGPARLLQVGTAQEVYEAPATAAVASLTGRVSFLTDGLDRRRAVRPHEALFSACSEGDCKVLRRRYCGNGWEIQIQTPKGDVILDQATDTPPDIGSLGRLEVSSNIWVPGKGQLAPTEA